jgi:hypothetical protein
MSSLAFEVMAAAHTHTHTHTLSVQFEEFHVEANPRLYSSGVYERTFFVYKTITIIFCTSSHFLLLQPVNDNNDDDSFDRLTVKSITLTCTTPFLPSCMYW